MGARDMSVSSPFSIRQISDNYSSAKNMLRAQGMCDNWMHAYGMRRMYAYNRMAFVYN